MVLWEPRNFCGIFFCTNRSIEEQVGWHSTPYLTISRGRTHLTIIERLCAKLRCRIMTPLGSDVDPLVYLHSRSRQNVSMAALTHKILNWCCGHKFATYCRNAISSRLGWGRLNSDFQKTNKENLHRIWWIKSFFMYNLGRRGNTSVCFDPLEFRPETEPNLETTWKKQQHAISNL